MNNNAYEQDDVAYWSDNYCSTEVRLSHSGPVLLTHATHGTTSEWLIVEGYGARGGGVTV